MNGVLPVPKYFVFSGKIDQIVIPVFSGSFASRHSNIAPEPSAERLMPRCRSYHSYIAFGSFALKNTPPSPVTPCIAPSTPPPPNEMKVAQLYLCFRLALCQARD